MANKIIEVPDKVWCLVIKAAILFAVCLLIGFMINFFSPRATLSMSPEERLYFWLALCLIGGAGIFICELFVVSLQIKLTGFAETVLQTLCGTIAVLIPLYQVYGVDEIPRFGPTLLFVWVVMILIYAGTYILSSKVFNTNKEFIAVEATGTAAPIEELAKILARLPVHLQDAQLYALSAEDHYVRIYTSKGNTMVLMRLSDAISETDGIEGLQIHRSWWVAKIAVEDVKTKDRSAEVILKNQLKAPVSRNALKTLRENRWL